MIKAPSTTADQQCLGNPRIRDLAIEGGLGTAAAEAVATIDEVMGRIRRNLLKREFGRRVLVHLGVDLDVAHLDVLASIHHADSGAAEAAPITVGLVAERLGIDPSRASRLCAELVDKGYARRIASQADARRIGLGLTRVGIKLIDAVHETKWRAFSKSMQSWTEEDLVVFSRLLDRFSTWIDDGLNEVDTAKQAAE